MQRAPHPSLRPLAVLASLVLALSTLFIVAFQRSFRLPVGVIPAHLVLVTMALLVAVLAAAVIRAVLGPRTRLAVLPLALLVTGLGLIDAINWVGRSLWVEVLSLRTILFYAPRIYGVAAGATEYPGLWVLAGIVLAAFLLFGIVFWFAAPLGAALSHVVDGEGLALFGRTRPALWSLVALGACSLLLGTSYGTMKDDERWRGEPLAGLLPGAQLEAPRRVGMVTQLPVMRFGRDGPIHRLASTDGIPVAPGPKNAILIVIDALRPDRLSLFGYPRPTMPALETFVAAGPALIADWATSTCSISGCGILGILGSTQYRRQHAGLATLPERLRAAGYDTFFLTSGDFSHGYPLLNDLFRVNARLFVDGFTHARYHPHDDRNILDALRSVPAYEGKPAFFYIHLLSVHAGGIKYRAPTYRPSFHDTALWASLTAGKGGEATASGKREGSADMRSNDYDNAVLQADEALGEVLALLTERGYLRDAVVVITSDHGEAFGEHGKNGHGHDLYAESINIPLIIRDTTFRRGHRVPYARQVDIAPTVTACLGLSAPATWEGQSLLAGAPAESFHQTTHPRPIEAVIWRTTRGTFKYIFDTRDRSESLYELESDPGERHDTLDTADPTIVSALREALTENFGTAAPGTPTRDAAAR